MAYFSNGTEGMIFEERYCGHCYHDREDAQCPVLTLHYLYNYDQFKDERLKTVLDTLIPQEPCTIPECPMFIKEGRVADG